MADWSKMRKVWTDARDKHGVKKGAVSGVSIGDAIDKVDSALGKGYGSVLSAGKALDTALDKYRAKLAKTNPDFVNWIDKNIAKDLRALTDAASLDLTTLNWMNTSIVRETVVSVENLYPDSAKASKAYDRTTAEKDPITWAEAVSEAKLFVGVEKGAPVVAKRLSTMKATKWNLTLNGRDKYYDTLMKYADASIEDVKFCIRWSKCADWSEYLGFMKESGSRTSQLAYRDAVATAIKTLMS